jgi:hypothetical protein
MKSTAFYCNLMTTFVMIFCQANMFAFLITPRFSRKKTVIIMNVVCLLCYVVFVSEQFIFGMNVTSQYMFFTLTVPSLIVNLAVSKYHGARFWFTFFFCDGAIANGNLAAWLIGQFTPLKGPGYGHAAIRCTMMLILTVFLIWYLRDKFQRLLATRELAWLPMAVLAFMIEFMMYFDTGYPRSIEQRPEDYIVVLMMTLVNITVLVLCVLIMVSLKNSMDKEKQQELLTAQYADRIERSRENYTAMMGRIDSVREMKHDMQHHIRIVQRFLEEGKQKECTEYLGRLMGEIGNVELKRYCDNDPVNMTVSWFATKAAADGIQFQFRGNIPDGHTENNNILVAVFSNILSNALDACSSVKEPYIRMDAGIHGDELVICCVNSFDGILKYDEDGMITTRKTEGGHGIGLKSIRDAAERSGGYMEIGNTGSEFTINVVIDITAGAFK